MDERYVSMVLSGSILANVDGRRIHLCERAEGWPVGGVAEVPCPPGCANSVSAKLRTWLGSIIKDAMIHQASELRDQLNAVLGVESMTWGEALDMVSNLRTKPKVSEPEVDLYEKGRMDGMEEAERILTEHYKDRQAALKNSEASMKEAEDIAASARNFYERKLVERDGISSCLSEIRKRIEENDR